MGKKFLSVLMAFALVVMLPVMSAFADELTTEPSFVETTIGSGSDEQATELVPDEPTIEPGFEDPAVDLGSAEATPYSSLPSPVFGWSTDTVALYFYSALVGTVEINYKGPGYFTPPTIYIVENDVPRVIPALPPGGYQKEGRLVLTNFPLGVIYTTIHFSAPVEVEVVLLGDDSWDYASGSPVLAPGAVILRQTVPIVGSAQLPDLSAPCTISDCDAAQVIDIPGSSKQAGAQAITFKDQQTANQRFKFDLDSKDGYYTITNINSGLVLDVAGGLSAAPGNAVIQFAEHGGDNQKWSIVNDGGHYAFVSKLSETLGYPLVLKTSYSNDGEAVSGAQLIASGTFGSEDGYHYTNQLFNINPQEQVSSLSYYSRCYINSAAGAVVLDIAEGSWSAGAPLIAFEQHGGPNQQFNLVYDAPTGYYRIINVKSGLPLDVLGSFTQKGTPVVQWTPHGAFNQLWSITEVGDDSYTITSASSGLVLDVSGGSATNGTKIITWPTHDGANQRWLFSPVPVP